MGFEDRWPSGHVIALPSDGELGAMAPVVVKFSLAWEKKSAMFLIMRAPQLETSRGDVACTRARRSRRFDEAGGQRTSLLREDQRLVEFALLHGLARLLHKIEHRGEIGFLLFG